MTQDQNNDQKLTKEDIIVYSTMACPYCHAVQAWLKDNEVEFTPKMVDTDMAAQKELMDKLDGNFQGVPVTFIKDTMVLGFDRNKLTTVLEENGIDLKIK